MSKTIIPANYTPALNLYDTQRAIGTVKRLFADTLCATLNLYRVSAPLFVEASTGLNDDLNGVERKVTFDTKDSGIEVQVDTRAQFRRQGLASACAAALILACLRRGLYPNWDAHNAASLALAEKLGYHLERAYPAFTLRPAQPRSA